MAILPKKLRKNYNIQIKRNFYLQQLIDGRLTSRLFGVFQMMTVWMRMPKSPFWQQVSTTNWQMKFRTILSQPPRMKMITRELSTSFIIRYVTTSNHMEKKIPQKRIFQQSPQTQNLQTSLMRSQPHSPPKLRQKNLQS